MNALALALTASLAWGIADFIGGVQSRRIPVLSVLLISQPFGLAAAVVWALSAGGRPPAVSELCLAAAAGLAGALGLGALFAAMRRGMIGLASPIAAAGVLVPFVYGLARGESPTPLALTGAVLAIGGILLAVHLNGWADRGQDGRSGLVRRRGDNRLSLLFAVCAALGFGVMYVAVALAAKHNPAWAVCAMRTGGCATIATGALIARRPFTVANFDLPRLAAIGILDVLGSSLYAVATRLGHLSLVAVAASLYPAVTVILAARILGERLQPSQRAGVVIAIAGVAAIAAGS